MKFRVFFTCFSLLSLLLTHAVAVSAQSAIDGFDAVASSSVEAIAVQGDGKILLGGAFTQVNFSDHAGIARLSVDGHNDAGFSASADSDVLAIAEQGNGHILLGGCFTHVDGTLRNYIARIGANGSLDATFNPNANGCVYALALQSDGKVLVGGGFTFIAGHAHSRIARLNSDGSLDATFVASANGIVEAIALQPDGKAVLAGNFTALDGIGHVGLGRVRGDGSLDAAFSAVANSNVFALALQADGKIVAGGQFTQMNNQPRHYLARLNTNGTLDTSFRDLNANGIVDALVRQSDGNLIIGGDFTSVDSGMRNHVARITRDIFVDLAFDPDATLTASTAAVAALALQSDGKLLVGGTFDHIGGQMRDNIARFYPGGGLDADLAYGVTDLPNADAAVLALALRADDRVVVGGYFNQIGAATRHNLAELNADGEVNGGFADPGFTHADSDDSVSALAFQPSQNLQPFNLLFVGGTYFDQPASIPNYLAQFTYQGGLTAFSAGIRTHNYGLHALALQSDGKMLLGGDFYQADGQSRFSIARLAANDGFDSTFDNALVQFGTSGTEAGIINALVEQADGKIVIGGIFDHVGNHAANRCARLDPDGSLDTSFMPQIPGTTEVTALALQPDGRIVVASSTYGLAGYLSRYNADGSTDGNFQAPIMNGGASALALQTDGKILLGGNFTQVNGYGLQEQRHYLARLNADGTIDTSFADWHADAPVRALLLQPDGKLVVGGFFTQPGYGIARLATTEPALQSLQLSADGSVIAWTRSGPAPALLFAPTLTWSTDGVTEHPIGTMSPFFSAWVYAGWSPPAATLVYVHARAISTDGSGHSAGTLIESVREFYASDEIFTNGFE
jgi:uncharacterized delta-60 repeat protein